jgi:hypothetical protein
MQRKFYKGNGLLLRSNVCELRSYCYFRDHSFSDPYHSFPAKHLVFSDLVFLKCFIADAGLLPEIQTHLDQPFRWAEKENLKNLPAEFH